MPVLPLIDLLIMVGWTSLMGAGLLKAIYVTTHYRPKLIGMGPGDFVLLAVACLLFALTLAARTWVKYHEPELMARRRKARLDELDEVARRGAQRLEQSQLAPLAEPRRAAAEGPRR